MQALDVGCGGGAVTLELARLAGAGGCVVGLDSDAAMLAFAKQDAAAAGLHTMWCNPDYCRVRNFNDP
jgi:ubiquinone/menaquinone biosynthesis C-methylase UbiE